MPLKERASCEAARREREKPRVSHSPCRFTALSLFREAMTSFAQEKKSQQAPEIDSLVRDRKVFARCHKIN